MEYISKDLFNIEKNFEKILKENNEHVDIKMRLKEIENETKEKLKEALGGDLLEEDIDAITKLTVLSMEKSIEGENSKRVPYKPQKSNIAKKIATMGVLGTLLVGTAIVSVKAEDMIKYYQTNHALAVSVQETQKEIINENTHRTNNGGYYYEYADLYKEVYDEVKDPSVALYLIFYNIGKTYTNDGINYFNYLYGTDYKSVDDFLEKNNYSSTREWRNYVANTIVESKDELNESNLGR